MDHLDLAILRVACLYGETSCRVNRHTKFKSDHQSLTSDRKNGHLFIRMSVKKRSKIDSKSQLLHVGYLIFKE